MNLEMTTKVKKDELVAIITTGRAAHAATYSAALKGWQEQMAAASKEVLARLDSGKLHLFPKEFRMLMEIPSLHLDDYDQALKMLEMSTEEEITLGPDDFDKLVMGNWHWRERWETTNSLYGG